VLKLVDELQVGGRLPPGRPRRTWRDIFSRIWTFWGWRRGWLRIGESGEDSSEHPTHSFGRKWMKN
jgi:hypothetical protein